MATVRELFSKLYAYILLFEQGERQGQASPSFDQVNSEIGALLEEQEAAARLQGMRDQDYQNARFAFVAWADETILRQSTGNHYRPWQALPLQLKYFQTRNAGEEFFERLERLSGEQREVREVYYLSLGLGFKGRYFLGLEDELRLNQIRHEQAQHLPVQVEDIQSIDKITPQPYQVKPHRGTPPKPPLTQLLLKIGVALLVAVPLVLLVIYRLRPEPSVWLEVALAGTGRGTISSAPAGISCGSSCSKAFPQGAVVKLKAVPEAGSIFAGWSGDPACGEEEITLSEAKTCTATFDINIVLSDEEIKKKIQAGLASVLQCAAVTVDIQGGRVVLGGWVASEEQRAESRRIAHGVQGVTQVDDTLKIVPQTFCEVVELLKPFKDHAEAQAYGLAMRLNKEEDPAVYLGGENMVIDVQTPNAFASHVYVDYYIASGSVGHLLPNPKEMPNTFQPNGQYTVGRLGGPQQWQIEPPYGLELVTVIASKTPLFAAPRLQPESATSYLQGLRQELAKLEKTDVAATFTFITTRDR